MFRRKAKAPGPLAVLVHDLENLADGDVRGPMWALDIRQGGRPAVERYLMRLAPEFGLGYLSPICAVFRRFERATTGRDLVALPDVVLKRRDQPDLQVRALESRAARIARVNARLAERRLAALRAGCPPPPR